jgi:hypothetical protein
LCVEVGELGFELTAEARVASGLEFAQNAGPIELEGVAFLLDL